MLVITKCNYKSHSLSITWANDDPSQWLIWTIGLLLEAHIRGPLNYYGLTLIPVWIYNYLHYKVWDELLTHSQTSKVAQLKLGMDKKFHPTHLEVCDYLSMLRFKLNHVSERGPWGSFQYPIKCLIVRSRNVPKSQVSGVQDHIASKCGRWVVSYAAETPHKFHNDREIVDAQISCLRDPRYRTIKLLDL